MSVTTTTGKPIGDYEDYHTEDGQPIADVSYFEQDAVIPLSGKYNLSDARKTTKSVKLSDVIGDIKGITPGTGLTGGGDSGTVVVGIDIENATAGQVLSINQNVDGVEWTSLPSVPSIPTVPSDTEQYVLGIKNGTLAWVKVTNLNAKDGSKGHTHTIEYTAYSPEP